MPLRSIFIKDWKWKLFSVASAVAIWLTAQSIRKETIAPVNPLGDWETRDLTNLPVFVVSSAADVREFKVSPNVVNVTIRARPEDLTELQAKEIHVTVDLTEIESARDLHKRVDVSAPPGLTVVQVLPSSVDVVVPPKRNKKS